MISLNTTVVADSTSEKPYKTYKLDLDSGRIIGYVDELDAVKQYIKKTILTPRYGCLIYGNNYGSEIVSSMVANHWNVDIAKQLIPTLVKEALTDSRVEDVYNFEFESEEESLYISFYADTIYGTVAIKEGITIV